MNTIVNMKKIKWVVVDQVVETQHTVSWSEKGKSVKHALCDMAASHFCDGEAQNIDGYVVEIPSR